MSCELSLPEFLDALNKSLDCFGQSTRSEASLLHFSLSLGRNSFHGPSQKLAESGLALIKCDTFPEMLSHLSELRSRKLDVSHFLSDHVSGGQTAET